MARLSDATHATSPNKNCFNFAICKAVNSHVVGNHFTEARIQIDGNHKVSLAGHHNGEGASVCPKIENSARFTRGLGYSIPKVTIPDVHLPDGAEGESSIVDMLISIRAIDNKTTTIHTQLYRPRSHGPIKRR